MIERTSDGDFISDENYERLFDLCLVAIHDSGGKIVENNKSKGILEARWRYGINIFGLRVRVLLKSAGNGKTETSFSGRFVDAVDTTGAADQKAEQVANRFAELVSQTTGIEFPTPPRNLVPVRSKSKAITATLALFLGGFGVHRFYLGTWGIALIYLLVLLPVSVISETPVSPLVAVADAIYFFGMHQTRFEERYTPGNVRPLKI